MKALDLHTYLETLDEGGIAVFIKTLDQGYLAINRSGAKTFERAPFEMIGGHDPDYFDASSAKIITERDQNIVSKGSTSVYDSIVQIKGDWLRFKTAKFPVTRANGEQVILGVSLAFASKPETGKIALLEAAVASLAGQAKDVVEVLLQMAPTRLPR